MKIQAISVFLWAAILTSCHVNATNAVPLDAQNHAVVTPTPSPTPVTISSETPKPKEKFDIHSKIGIVDVVSDKPGCLRTKNGDLAEKTPVSIIILPYDDAPIRVLTATVEREVYSSCARRASEIGDKNPGENHFYLLSLNEKLPEFFGFEVGFGVIEPAQPVKIQNKLASIDLDSDGKPEFFRRCSGNEGTLFAIWKGKPLKGRQIWWSFYYVDYDTVADCKKADYAETED